MFRKTDSNPQFDMFENVSNHLSKRGAKKYDDPNGWHNQFYNLVTSKIDEEVFSPLFTSGSGRTGAPNASIRQLVALSILKEGYGCSDEALFEKCEFDLLTRKALGLVQLGDKVVSLDTWYLFRRRICEYDELHGVNLMELCFSQVTGEQARQFNISGKTVRMDSKLIGRNIAWYSRYELIHSTFCHEMNSTGLVSRLNPSLRRRVESILGEDAPKTVYRSSGEQIGERITLLGQVIYEVLVRVKAGGEVTGDTVETVIADGAYQGPDNRDFAKDNDMELITRGLQGGSSRLQLIPDGDSLTVVDNRTGEIIPAVRTKEKWRIPHPNPGTKSKYRYFTPEQVEASGLRRALRPIPPEKTRMRNNVEASIFQYCFHLRNNKTRYRGLLKQKLFSYARCMWINSRRLGIFLITATQRTFIDVLSVIKRSLNGDTLKITSGFSNRLSIFLDFFGLKKSPRRDHILIFSTF